MLDAFPIVLAIILSSLCGPPDITPSHYRCRPPDHLVHQCSANGVGLDFKLLAHFGGPGRDPLSFARNGADHLRWAARCRCQSLTSLLFFASPIFMASCRH